MQNLESVSAKNPFRREKSILRQIPAERWISIKKLRMRKLCHKFILISCEYWDDKSKGKLLILERKGAL